MKVINRKWLEEQVDLMASPEYSTTQSDPLVKKHIVYELVKKGYPFQVSNLGAGVSKISRTPFCTKCGRP